MVLHVTSLRLQNRRGSTQLKVSLDSTFIILSQSLEILQVLRSVFLVLYSGSQITLFNLSLRTKVERLVVFLFTIVVGVSLLPNGWHLSLCDIIHALDHLLSLSFWLINRFRCRGRLAVIERDFAFLYGVRWLKETAIIGNRWRCALSFNIVSARFLLILLAKEGGFSLSAVLIRLIIFLYDIWCRSLTLLNKAITILAWCHLLVCA